MRSLGRICGNCCRFCCYAFCGLSTALAVVAGMIVVFGIPFLILWFISNWIWGLGAVVFWQELNGILENINVVLGGLAELWNLIRVFLPDFSTLWNILVDIVWAIIKDLASIVCTQLPFTPGFEPALHCSAIYDLLSIAPTIISILNNTVMFLVFLVEALGSFLEDFLCLERPIPIFTTALPHTDPTCHQMCIALGLLPGCYSFTNGIHYILTGSGIHFLVFLVNVFDRIFFTYGIGLSGPHVFPDWVGVKYRVCLGLLDCGTFFFLQWKRMDV